MCDLGSLAKCAFSLTSDILAKAFPAHFALHLPNGYTGKLCTSRTYLDDVDGVDEGHSDDGGSSGHADLLEKSRSGGGAGGEGPSFVGVGEGGVGEAHFDVGIGI